MKEYENLRPTVTEIKAALYDEDTTPDWDSQVIFRASAYTPNLLAEVKRERRLSRLSNLVLWDNELY